MRTHENPLSTVRNYVFLDKEMVLYKIILWIVHVIKLPFALISGILSIKCGFYV